MKPNKKNETNIKIKVDPINIKIKAVANPKKIVIIVALKVGGVKIARVMKVALVKVVLVKVVQVKIG